MKKNSQKRLEKKDMLLLILRHIRQTNEVISSLIAALEEQEEPVPAIVKPAALKELLSVEDASGFTGYSKKTLYALVSGKKIPCHKPTGGRVFFKRSELEEFVCRSKQSADYEVSDAADAILNGEA